MGRQLLADEPAFAAAVDKLEPVFVEQVGFSLRQVLESGEPVVGIDRIQPVLVGMQLALTALWRSYGVEPDAVIGHSMGEVAAAVVAGALSPADGLKVIATRSMLMSRLSGQGAMALLELEADAVEAFIADHPDTTVAVHASPRQTVIAGPPEQVDAVIAAVEEQDRLARRIEVDVASHNPIIDPILPELRSALSDIVPTNPRIPLLDTAGAAPTFDADYWAANLRNPVRFHQAVSAAGADHGTFVEVSPHPVLTHAITDTLAGQHHHSIATLIRNTDDTQTFHTNLNATYTTHPPQIPHPPEPHATLPTTPWRHTHHWIPHPKDGVDTIGSAPRAGTLLGGHLAVATTPPTQLWQARLVPEAKPYPGSHRIQGVEVVPVSVLLQTVLAAAAECGAPGVADVRFEHPVVVDQPRLIQVVVDAGAVTVSSSPTAGSGADGHRWVRHVTADLWSSGAELDGDGDAVAIVDGHRHDVTGAESQSVAELLAAWGVEGQPFPWSVGPVRHTADGAVAEISVPQASTAALLDAAVHVACLVDRSNPRLMMPAAVHSVRLGAAPADEHASIQIRRRNGNHNELVVDICVKTLDGGACIDIRTLRYADVDSGLAHRLDDNADPRSFAHAIEWQLWREDDDWPAPVPGPLAVVGPDDTASADLRDQLAGAGYTPVEVAEARDVVYLAYSGSGGSADAGIDAAVRVSTQVCGLVQALAARGEQHPARLWIITRGVHQAISDEALAASSLWGIAAVIAAEQPDLWGGLVDIPLDDPVGESAAALGRVLGQRGRKPSKSILVLHAGELLAQALVPISGSPVREPLRCRPEAAYLITGGLGELGLLMADWLADRGARRLVLTGRTALPPRHDWDSDDHDTDVSRKIAAIKALEHRGVSVDAVAVDVGVPEAVQALLARRDRDGAPPIRGVIHAAGVTANKLLTDMADRTLRQVMWPKIAGGKVLHDAFPPSRLDFFFLTASAGTVFGVPGQGAYAAANAYLDCLARIRHRQGCHTVSLDWVAWEGLGFGADATITNQELERLGSRPVLAEEAFAAWEHVDRHDIAQAVIAPMSSAEPGVDHAPASVRAWSVMTAEELLDEIEAGLRGILGRELGLPETELEPDLPFVELGLNSVMAMSIRREVEQFAGIELSVTMLWNHPTVAALAAHLANKLAPQQDSEDGSVGQSDSESSVLDDLLGSVESASS
jgi:phthiocerol/phenolphthiocerol synthesis type-I polyketide synthase A